MKKTNKQSKSHTHGHVYDVQDASIEKSSYHLQL